MRNVGVLVAGCGMLALVGGVAAGQLPMPQTPTMASTVLWATALLALALRIALATPSDTE